MEERDQILIERYLAMELTAIERNEVEHRAQLDPDFKKELTEYQLAIEAIKIAQREELKNRFRNRDKLLDRNSIRHLKPGRNIWMMAASVLLMIAFAWWLYKAYQAPIMEDVITIQDSIKLENITEGKIDTTVSHKMDRASGESKENKKQIKPRDRGRELYAANFEPYRDDSMEPTTRGDVTELEAFDRFQIHYWEKDYAKAIAAFDQMSPTMKQNDNLRFLYANVLMGVGRIDEAINILSDIIRNNKSIYKTEANLYLALSLLKDGNEIEAKKHLEIYLKDEASEQKEKAKRILASLN